QLRQEFISVIYHRVAVVPAQQYAHAMFARRFEDSPIHVGTCSGDGFIPLPLEPQNWTKLISPYVMRIQASESDDRVHIRTLVGSRMKRCQAREDSRKRGEW